VPEFLGGGMALATVALIAFGALRFAPSHNSPPPPANYAPVSIESPEVSVKSLVEQPKESSDVAATRDVRNSLGSVVVEVPEQRAAAFVGIGLLSVLAKGDVVGLRELEHR